MNLSYQEFKKLPDEVECEPFAFDIGCFECEPGFECDKPLRHIWFIRAKLYRQDSVTHEMGWGYGDPLVVFSSMDPEVVVKKFFVAAANFAHHEVREAFKWKGREVLGPHVPLEVIWEALG